VSSDITLAKLHRILQCVMGWEDAYLYVFVVGDDRYSVPNEEDMGPRRTRDERKYKLSELVPEEGSRFRYKYDFGDYWQHVLVIEKILPPQEGARYPICLAGARACPPEDVGGASGYEDFLRAINNPDHSEHDEYLEWIGGSFEPEAFHLDAVNQRLRGIR